MRRSKLSTLLLSILLSTTFALAQHHRHHRSPTPRPAPAHTAPAGATARCRDGTYSFSQHRRGTCSHHGGVAEWLP